MSTDYIAAMREIFAALAEAPGHIYPTGKPGEPVKRFISTITRDSSGALVITGAAGTRSYIGYTQREAEARYNTEAKQRRRRPAC